MIISCIGDSLTEGDYGIRGKTGIPNVQERNYPYFLSQEMQCRTNNFGKCGFRSIEYLDYYLSGNIDLEGSDVVLIMLGTNGGHSIEKETPANIAYESLIEKIKKDVPGAALFLLTPPHATQNPEMSNYGYRKQAEIASKYVKRLAEIKNLPVIDVWGYKEFCDENESIYQPNDGLHFGETGYKELAHFVAEELKKQKNTCKTPIIIMDDN